MPKIKCPVLVAHSKGDKVAPCDNSIELAKLNKKAEVFLSEDGNHWNVAWCLERVDEFANSLIKEPAEVTKEKTKGLKPTEVQPQVPA